MTTQAGLPDRRQEAEAVRLLAEQVYSLTGYDFRDYALDALRPRLQELARAEGVESADALRERLLSDPAALGRAVEALAWRPSTLFRDPDFFAALRREVIPLLKTYPTVRIWNAGCGTGEEAYSLAIVLQEEGLLERCRLYGTDLSAAAVRAAKTGSYPLGTLRGAAEAHAAAGGKAPLSAHYTVQGPLAVFSEALRQRVFFSEHSLASDASFNEFHLVVSRDVTPQFNRSLQERCFRLFDESLCPLGILALGRNHVLGAHGLAMRFAPVPDAPNIYRKVR
jgi:chemotaxis protein methyltransferase CheR